ncbi:MAG: ribbon-helix-helix domain-containing protein [Alphaproteobacteria bacterium]
MAKRSITIAGHRTSISLEDDFWHAAAEIAAELGCSLAELVGQIDSQRPPQTNLSSAIRVYILRWYRDPRSG